MAPSVLVSPVRLRLYLPRLALRFILCLRMDRLEVLFVVLVVYLAWILFCTPDAPALL